MKESMLNTTKKTTISRGYKLCSSQLSKSIGLMFHLVPKTLVFVFEKDKTVPLHMMFVFFPIDVLYLDKNKKIVEIKEDFKPFTFYKPKRKARYVVELAAGAASSSRTKLGDKIRF